MSRDFCLKMVYSERDKRHGDNRGHLRDQWRLEIASRSLKRGNCGGSGQGWTLILVLVPGLVISCLGSGRLSGRLSWSRPCTIRMILYDEHAMRAHQ